MSDVKGITIKQLFKELNINVSTYELKSAMIAGRISAKITSKRYEMKMNQVEFAHYMGVTQGMVSKWEKGIYNFSIEKLIEVFDKLKMDVDFEIIDREHELKGLIKANGDWDHDPMDVEAKRLVDAS